MPNPAVRQNCGRNNHAPLPAPACRSGKRKGRAHARPDAGRTRPRGAPVQPSCLDVKNPSMYPVVLTEAAASKQRKGSSSDPHTCITLSPCSITHPLQVTWLQQGYRRNGGIPLPLCIGRHWCAPLGENHSARQMSRKAGEKRSKLVVTVGWEKCTVCRRAGQALAGRKLTRRCARPRALTGPLSQRACMQLSHELGHMSHGGAISTPRGAVRTTTDGSATSIPQKQQALGGGMHVCWFRVGEECSVMVHR